MKQTRNLEDLLRQYDLLAAPAARRARISAWAVGSCRATGRLWARASRRPSAATSTEEIGNPPHRGTVAKLREVGIPVVAHRARQVRRAEYGNWDHIVYMDAENARGLRRIFGSDPDGKISRLLDWTDRPGDVADPWYTGNFDATYRDVLAGCTAMLEQL